MTAQVVDRAHRDNESTKINIAHLQCSKTKHLANNL